MPIRHPVCKKKVSDIALKGRSCVSPPLFQLTVALTTRAMHAKKVAIFLRICVHYAYFQSMYRVQAKEKLNTIYMDLILLYWVQRIFLHSCVFYQTKYLFMYSSHFATFTTTWKQILYKTTNRDARGTWEKNAQQIIFHKHRVTYLLFIIARWKMAEQDWKKWIREERELCIGYGCMVSILW